jgi:WD40 repeat protein
VFSPDGSRVASGSHDKTVRVWDVQTGECQSTLEGHSDGVESVVFSPDGSRVASGSHDGTVRAWDIASTTELLCYDAGIRNNEIEFCADSTRILINGKSVLIPLQTLLFSTAAVVSSLDLNSRGRLGIEDEWIIWASERILWLPPEYRPRSWASRNDVAVVGSGTGRITFVRRVTKTSFQRENSARQWQDYR